MRGWAYLGHLVVPPLVVEILEGVLGVRFEQGKPTKPASATENSPTHFTLDVRGACKAYLEARPIETPVPAR